MSAPKNDQKSLDSHLSCRWQNHLSRQSQSVFLLHLEALLKTHPSAQKQPHKDPGHNDQGPYAAKVQLGYLSAAALSLANLAVLASCCSRVVA